MRLVFGLVLIAGLGMAGFAVKMAMDYIGAYEAALAQERQKVVETIPTTPIYIATRALQHGDTLTADAVRLVDYPTEILPQGHFTAEASPVSADTAPRRVLRGIEPNEPLMAVKLSEPGGDAGLASRLQPGERAFAIKVDVASGVSGFLRPSDLVDVYWTGRVRGNGIDTPEGDVTRLIESGVRLIAIDQSSSAEATEIGIARTVTVAASPRQVAALAQAQSTGKMTLSLMGRNDEAVSESIEVDSRALLGLGPVEPPEEQVARVEPAPAPAPETCSIRTRRGAEVVETPIPCTN